MKYSDDQSLGSAIREFFKAYQLEDKLNETRLIRSWETVVGKVIAKHTREVKIRNRILFVKIDSSALKNELSYQKEKIMQSLNNEAGANVIDDVVFN